MNKLDRYKVLKERLDFVYKGIHLNRVLALFIWSLANDDCSFFTWRSNLLIFSSINVCALKFDIGKHRILSTFGRQFRSDHLFIYNSVINRIGEKVSCNNMLDIGRIPCFYPILAVRLWFSLRSHMTGLAFSYKWKYFVLCLHYCNTIEKLDKISFQGVEKYLSMYNALDFENLMTQYMNIRNIETYSLQEGLYSVFKTNIPRDAVQYENIETHNLLCWSQFTINEFASYGISINRLRLAGYPLKIMKKQMNSENLFRKCIILVARDIFRDSNVKLLNILACFSGDYEFYLKLHPSCDFQYYSQCAIKHNMSIVSKEIQLKDCLDNRDYDFAIAINTTAYYEALLNGIPCLRYYDGLFDLTLGYNDVFTSGNEFIERLEGIRNISYEEYQSCIDEILLSSIGYGVDNYNVILSE